MGKIGKCTYSIDKPVYITSTYSIAGPMEGEGSFKEYYDLVLEDDEWGCKSHEKCEIKIHKKVIDGVIEDLNLKEREVDCIMGGDLLNQIISTSFSAREFEIPFVGLYEACSTFGEALSLGAMLISGGFMDNVVCCTSSHYGTAERQYRYPLELGTQPCPASQWTVTGSGAVMLSSDNRGRRVPRITNVTIGKIVDLGINDVNNMGAAMAPAAADTIISHLTDIGKSPEYYDLIITGDLGKYGRTLLEYLCSHDGVDASDRLNDCGALIYSDEQKSIQGGSGAGCSSLVFASYLYKELLSGGLKRILLVPTGALLSKLSSLQGETIPSVAHAVAIEMCEY